MKKIYLIILALGAGISQLTAQAPHFFGVTTDGGGDAAGTIYRTDTNGTNFSLIDTFSVKPDGVNPYNQELLEVNGKMYGVTYSGGNNNKGTLFEFDPATNNFTVRNHFDDSTGSYPRAYLFLGANGNIYGTAQQGGANSSGTFFEYNTTTNTFARKVSFDGATTGRNPNGKLVETSSGVFYGVTSGGGSNNNGTVFKYTLSTNTLEKKDDFVNVLNGTNAVGGLMKSTSGILYGMASYGGANNKGTLFQYDLTADSIKKIVDFDGVNGQSAAGVPIQIWGDLYGLTYNGGPSVRGTLFNYHIASDTIGIVRYFISSAGYPTGNLVPSTAGKFLILMSSGGANFQGTVTEFTMATKGLSTLASFESSITGSAPRGNLKKSSVNGKYYGLTYNGGTGNYGTIFEFDHATNTIINKHNFSTSNNGKTPTGTLVKAPNGKLYGITQVGGIYGSGTIFEVDLITQNVIKKVDFVDSIGKTPAGGLTLATNGKLYGVTTQGGVNNSGTIFEYNISTNTLIKLKDMNTFGRAPSAELIQASNGKLYGTAYFGGAYGRGILFSYDITLDTLIVNDSFDPSVDGGYPYAKLMQAANGKLYGTTLQFGLRGRGTVYEFDIALDSIRVIDHFTDSNGANSYGGLTQIANGNIYGITRQGSITGTGSKNGVVYQLDLVGDSIIPLHNFVHNNTGYGGYGEFLEASNGKLYITSYYSLFGTRAATINEFDPVAGTFIRKLQLPSGRTYGSLIELVSPNSASIDEKKITQELLVYPNPTNSILNIDTKGERIVGLKIFSVSGQLIESRLKENNTIDVSQFNSGLYIIQVETQNGIALSRFIKK